MRTACDKPQKSLQERGQSLVEVALALPIFIVLLAGLVEYSQFTIAKSRIETAARAGAREGSIGRDPETLHVTALNAVQQTMIITDSSRWDIWVIEGTMHGDGTDFLGGDGGWNVSHIYGISQTEGFTTAQELVTCSNTPIIWDNPDANDCLRDQIVAELRLDPESGDPAPNRPTDETRDLQIIGLYIVSDIESILGLNAIPAVSEIFSVTGFSFLRITAVGTASGTQGCDAVFPIVLDRGIRSLTADNFPDASAFSYPTSPPLYTFFPDNVSDRPLDSSSTGNIFRVDRGAVQFGWVKWNTALSSGPTTLRDSLTWPGDSDLYIEPGEPGDQEPHENDRVAANEGGYVDNYSTGIVGPVLASHVDTARQLRIMVTEEGGAGPSSLPGLPPFHTIDEGGNGGFALFRMHGFGQGSGTEWLLMEFIRWDDSCGNVDPFNG